MPSSRSASRTTRTRGSRSRSSPPTAKEPSKTPSAPIRTCAGCGRKAPQQELQRFHSASGTLVPGGGDGRGAYTCRRLACFERALAHRGFNRTLRATIRVDPELARLYN